MSWFKRKEKGITTSTEEKKDTPKGLWYKSPTGKIIDTEELEKNFYVSPEDGYHVRIGSKEYFEILFDDIAASNSRTVPTTTSISKYSLPPHLTWEPSSGRT
jgi:acetyl-CoA carboxylase beta subunit